MLGDKVTMCQKALLNPSKSHLTICCFSLIAMISIGHLH